MKQFAFACLLGLSAIGSASQSVYFNGSFSNGWGDSWSWGFSLNPKNTSPVHSGTYSMSVTETGTYQGLYFNNNAQSTSGLHALQFWVNGGATGGQSGLVLQCTLSGAGQVQYPLPPLPKNQWLEVTVPLVGSGAGAVNNFDGFWIMDASGKTQAKWYIDDIQITSPPTSVLTQPMYGDALENSWTNASTAETNFSVISPVHSGSHSISVTQEKASDDFSLAHADLDGTEYQTVIFWINGGPKGGQELQLTALESGVPQTGYSLPTLAKNTWTEIVVPLQDLGVSARGDLNGFTLSNRATSVPATYYVDDIELSVVPAVNPLATIGVSTATKTAISPFIYGVNSTDWAGLGKGFTFSRMGGNRLTAYNWENNASNAGSDWVFQNDDYMGASNTAGWTDTNFITQVQAEGAAPLLTVQMMGYVAADKNPPGNVNLSANYLTTRMRYTEASKPGYKYVYPPSTSDQYVYQDEFVNYIKQFAAKNQPLMFALDNEPDLWNSTWQEMHPKATTYAEELADSVAYSTSIKRVYPVGLVFGPVSYGWEGYRTFQNAPDANGRDFLAFYLAGMASASKTAGKRLLDALDLHWYPAATGDNIWIIYEGDSLGEAAARIQCPRSLWDGSYVEDSWITVDWQPGKAIDLIPGTQSIINANYPGTKLSFTEYNYGGGNTISGAIAQADVLGIFGREGVYAAANWGLASTEASELAGFQSFINYDRAGSKFGDLGLNVTGTSAPNNSVYAALDSTNAKRMTLVVINKTIGTTPFTIDLTGFTVNSSKGYTVTAGNYATPLKASIVNLSDAISFNAPPLSVTTIELLSK